MTDLSDVLPLADPFSAFLADQYGLTRCDGGYRVKETETHWVDVVRMIYNWRVARTPKDAPWRYDRGWCYAGTDPASFITAVLAALAWDGADSTEPAGWNKNIQTGEWREPG